MLTATIPGREHFLAECRQSVLYQTYSGWEHLRMLDDQQDGFAATMNALAEHAQGDWLLPLCDDDLMLPGCLDSLVTASVDGDIIYSPPLVWGVKDPWWYFDEPPKIPAFALIRASLWRQLDGYDYQWNREEDRRLWERAVEHGAKFVKVADEPTWVYRIHAGSKSFNNGVAS